MAHGPATSTGGLPPPTSMPPTDTTLSPALVLREVRYERFSCAWESCMLAWKICLNRAFRVASSNGPALAATNASSICCSRTGSYCDMPLAVCSLPISAATDARSESSSRMLRFSSSMRARRLWSFCDMTNTTLADPHDQDGELEQHDEGHTDQREVEGVPSGGDDGCQREADDDGPAPVLPEELVAQQAGL